MKSARKYPYISLRFVFQFSLLIVFFFPIRLWSQDSSIVQVMSVEQGLPQNSILAMEEDLLGNLWIGTEAGISSWNGLDMIHYPREGIDPFPPGYVSLIHRDFRSRLWIVAGDGNLYFWNEWMDRFEKSTIFEGALQGEIRLIGSDPVHGDLILYTSTGKVYRWFSTEDPQPLLVADLGNIPIHQIIWNGREILLGGESGWELLPARRKRSSSYTRGSEYADLPVYDVVKIGHSLFAARGEEGLTRYDLENRTTPEHYDSLHAFKLEQDSKGNLLILEKEDSLALWDVDTGRVSQIRNLPAGCTDLLRSDFDQILFKTRSSGIWMYDPYRLNIETQSPGKTFGSSSDIMHFLESESGEIWMAGYDGGLYAWDREQGNLRRYSQAEKHLPTDSLKYIEEDNQGRLWIGSYDKGFFIFDRERETWSRPEIPSIWSKSLNESKVNQIYKDTRGLFWICTDKGLFRLNTSSGYFVSMGQAWAAPELSRTCWAIMEDQEGIFWIGTEKGLIRANEKGIIQRSEGNYRKNWMIQQDSRGLVYVGSPSGLEIYNRLGEPVILKGIEERLKGLNIYGFLEDSLGAIWFTTNQGAFRWDPSDDEILHLGEEDGLLSREFNLNSLGLFSDGNILLGGIEGVQIINPREPSQNPPLPVVSITDIQVNSTRISDSGYTPKNILPQSGIRDLKHLDLKPQDNHVIIFFSVTDFYNHRNRKVEYRMQSLNPQWIDVSGVNRVNFIGLKPGEHRFELRISADSGEFSRISSLEIHLASPFYRTWWFLTILISALILMVITIFRYIGILKNEVAQRRIAEEKFKEFNSTLEDQVKHRTSELEQTLENLKKAQQQVIEQEKMSSLGQVVAGVAHEINTPLGVAVLSNSILQDIIWKLKNEIESEELTKEGLKEYIKELDQAETSLRFNLDRAATLVKNFKQVAIEKNQLEIIEFDLCSSIQSLLNSLYNEFKRKGVTTITHLPPQCLIFSYPSDVSQIITNLLMNSLIHGFKKPIERTKKIITLSLVLHNEEVVLRIRDNGQGIPEKNIPQIFNPFFTTNRENGGTGLGLNIVYNTVKEKLRGQIQVDSTPGHGAEFVITLPRKVTQSH